MDVKGYSSFIQEWIKGVKENRGKNPENTMRYCNNLLSYASPNNDIDLLGFAYYYLGETYYYINDGRNFFTCISKAIAYLENSTQDDLLAAAYNSMGIMASSRGNSLVAMDNYNKGLAVCLRLKDGISQRAAILCNIANLCMSCDRNEEAIIYLLEAQEHLLQEQAIETYHMFYSCIVSNLAKCYINEGKIEQAKMCFSDLEEYRLFFDKVDEIIIACIKTVLYHRTEETQLRDACIEKVGELASVDIPIMDVFDDYYAYAEVLLEMDKDDAFWEMLDILEPLVRQSQMINMQMRLLSLKIRYYRRKGKSAEYLQATGLYYELTELQEKESKSMLSVQIEIQRNLAVSEAKRVQMEIQNRELRARSERDPLTKMANRYRLNEFSELAFQKAYNNHTSLAVEILDIDYFKEFNDNYGHQRGDEGIVAVGNIIQSLANRHNGFCARYGGDEFILIYENVTEEQAIAFAKELRKEIMDLHMEHKYSKALPFLTVSQGVCCDIPKEDNKVWDFLHAADAMLYKVKKESRNNYGVTSLQGSR